MDQKMEREWKSIVCPDGKAKSVIMCEWDILSEEGRIQRKTLKQIDSYNPRLTEFGGTDCSWGLMICRLFTHNLWTDLGKQQ